MSHLLLPLLDSAQTSDPGLLSYLLSLMFEGKSEEQIGTVLKSDFSFQNLQCCPFDQTAINTNLPENEAILGLVVGYTGHTPQSRFAETYGVSNEDAAFYFDSIEHIKQLAAFLKPHQQTSEDLSNSEVPFCLFFASI